MSKGSTHPVEEAKRKGHGDEVSQEPCWVAVSVAEEDHNEQQQLEKKCTNIQLKENEVDGRSIPSSKGIGERMLEDFELVMEPCR
jgi:hypothetical protein